MSVEKVAKEMDKNLISYFAKVKNNTIKIAKIFTKNFCFCIIIID